MHKATTPGERCLSRGAARAAVLAAAAFLAVPAPAGVSDGVPRASAREVSIAVDYGGSWKLRYKLYYHEVADSETRELHGFGRRVVPVEPRRELVNLCAWLSPTGVVDGRERLGVRIVVVDGASREERRSPPSLFSRTSSACFHF